MTRTGRAGAPGDLGRAAARSVTWRSWHGTSAALPRRARISPPGTTMWSSAPSWWTAAGPRQHGDQALRVPDLGAAAGGPGRPDQGHRTSDPNPRV